MKKQSSGGNNKHTDILVSKSFKTLLCPSLPGPH